MPTVGVRITQRQLDSLNAYLKKTGQTRSELLKDFINTLVAPEEISYHWVGILSNITRLTPGQLRYFAYGSGDFVEFVATIDLKAADISCKLSIEKEAYNIIVEQHGKVHNFTIEKTLPKIRAIRAFTRALEDVLLGDIDDCLD